MRSFQLIIYLVIISNSTFSTNTTNNKSGGWPLKKNCRVIYDNDDHRDVYTDEYLLALSSIGEIKFKGIITTYSPREYSLFVEGRKQIIELSKRSGLKNIPELFHGTNKQLKRPGNNKIEDTSPLMIEGSDFIVSQALKATPKNPLVIVTGGQLTSVANAYLINPSIAENILVMGVFGAKNMDYNAGLDAWAWTIILNKLRVIAIPIGPPDSRGEVYMKPPVVPKERIKTELDQAIPFFKWMYEKEHPSNELPNEGDFDGQPAILITKPHYVTQWKRFNSTGINERGHPILEENENGKIWQAENASQQIATDEFWRVMHKLNKQLK